METVELRDPDEARLFLLQGLWLTRVLRPVAPNVKHGLDWALEIASSGQPLPPIGFVADVGGIIFGIDGGKPSKEQTEIPHWPHGLIRSYEDHLLGKIFADWTFERATDALRRYAPKDHAKGLAYVVKQIRERGRLGGVELSPAVIRSLRGMSGEDCLNQGYDFYTRHGPMPLLIKQYEALVSAARRMAEVLGPEDVIALEQRMALAEMGQYVAHRQVLQMTAKMEAALPTRPVKPKAGRKEVPTRVHDEDQYPVGGYSSISNRGSIESLLHSQLAYMEERERPDLFDVKFVRDELFFYSRDENQFLRRRRIFTFIFDSSMSAARTKDSELPCQRIVLALSTVLALIRRLSDWLSEDAIKFELVFPKSTERNVQPLKEETVLLEILLMELREAGAAVVYHAGNPESPAGLLETSKAAVAYADAQARTSQVHVLLLSQKPLPIETQLAVVTSLEVNQARPILRDGHGDILPLENEDPLDDWIEAVELALQLWV